MKTKYAKTPFLAAFSVGAVLFSAHAGGGFATGNQANTYYVGLGWAGVASAIVAMLLLTLTMREAMIMYNSRGLTGHKELFETLYHPFDKLVWLFEIFFYIMVLMAVAAAISGAASALTTYFGLNYYLGVVAVGALVLVLTIFGAGIVRAASTYMGIAILVTAITIYAVGIFNSERTIMDVLAADFQTTGFADVPTAIVNAFTYAGFQCVTLPTMVACGTTMRNKQGCAKAMWISFVMNAVALVLSVFMLLCWENVYTAVDGGTTIPTLTVCNTMGIQGLTVIYGICLLLCLFLTGILVYGSARRYVIKKDTVHAFYAQYAAFVEASEEDSGGGIFSDILNFNREGDLPQEIQEMGFESVYFDDGVAYFTHKDASAWTGSFGILRTADTKNVPSWYILEPIEREWYYWRMS